MWGGGEGGGGGGGVREGWAAKGKNRNKLSLQINKQEAGSIRDVTRRLFNKLGQAASSVWRLKSQLSLIEPLLPFEMNTI